MNAKNRFCKSLAEWMVDTPWGFAPLLAVCINSVDQLPDDADELVRSVLDKFPSEPDARELEEFLNDSLRIEQWFTWLETKPTINAWNLHEQDTEREFALQVPPLETMADVADWLRTSEGKLIWLADLFRHHSGSPHYHYYAVPKRREGFRLIEAPKRQLRDIQRQINSEILQYAPIDKAAHGYVAGKSCMTHAANHTAKQRLFLFDIQDFFPSIGWHAVYTVFFNLGYPKEVARVLAGLCTHRISNAGALPDEIDHEQKLQLMHRHLPQGAPTSPALSNSVVLHLDRRLRLLAGSLELEYSRYADDIAFSGNRQRDWRFLEPLIGAICFEEGFHLNFRKSKIIRSHARQKVTGVVVNAKPNLDRREFDRLKAILTNCIRHGLESQNRSGHEDFRLHLEGRVSHAQHLNPARGAKLRSLLDQI